MIATSIGRRARELLRRDGTAALLGHTSRGAFLALASGEPLFLSLEAYRGPLTVNVSGEAPRLRGIPLKAAARIHAQEIIFEEHDLSIRASSAETWQAPPRPEGMLPEPERLRRLQDVRREALRIASPEGMFSLFASPGSGDHPLLPAMKTIGASLRGRQIEALAGALLPFLGWGRGLTPSGDDLALGLLLALNRWGDVLAPGLEVGALNRLALPAAAQRTTTLSASLIACAADSQADERLVAALDGLVCGGMPAEALVAGIAGWGNSSGLDALAGMLLAIAP